MYKSVQPEFLCRYRTLLSDEKVSYIPFQSGSTHEETLSYFFGWFLVLLNCTLTLSVSEFYINGMVG